MSTHFLCNIQAPKMHTVHNLANAYVVVHKPTFGSGRKEQKGNNKDSERKSGRI